MKFNNNYSTINQRSLDKPKEEYINQKGIKYLNKVMDLFLEADSEEHFENTLKDVKILIKELTEFKLNLFQGRSQQPSE